MVYIRYIAVLGFQQTDHKSLIRELNKVYIRYIAVLGFQLNAGVAVSDPVQTVYIRYIAVLGFQRCPLGSRKEISDEEFTSAISRYLVSNGWSWEKTPDWRGLHPLYRGTWFPTIWEREVFLTYLSCLHPLYRGTWFPTCGYRLVI